MHILMRSEQKPHGVLFVQPAFHEVRQDGPDGEIVGIRLLHSDYFDEIGAYSDHYSAHNGEPDFVPSELFGAKALFDLDWVMEPGEDYHKVLTACQIELKGENLWWVETRELDR